MAEEIGWDPLWWKKAKQLSLEQREAKAEALATARAGDSFLIVTEGTVTEPIYFEALRTALHLSAVKVRIEPGKASDARHVIDTGIEMRARLEDRAKKGQLALNAPSTYDQVWAVVDTDVPERLERWPEVIAYAEANNVRLAHTTPCVEYWLLLHLKQTTGLLLNSAAARAALKAELGEYSKSEEETKQIVATLLPQWPEAVKHARFARNHHRAAATPSPANPSTSIDLLVTGLNFAAPPYARKLVPELV
jgi:hypothetical protein